MRITQETGEIRKYNTEPPIYTICVDTFVDGKRYDNHIVTARTAESVARKAERYKKRAMRKLATGEWKVKEKPKTEEGAEEGGLPFYNFERQKTSML